MDSHSPKVRIAELAGHPVHAVELEFGRLSFFHIHIAKDKIIDLVDGFKMQLIHKYSMRLAQGFVK